MAQTHTWHPGSACVNARWPLAVPLLPDELFSSWITRAARAAGCEPLSFVGGLWPEWRGLARDLDRPAYTNELGMLSQCAGIPAAAFQAGTLRPIARRIYGAEPPERQRWPWILSLGIRNTKRRAGPQYCPACLGEDSTPYYRLAWRLAWHTVCERHGCVLGDDCPHCGAPVMLHRLMPDDRSTALCAVCKADLRRAPVSPGSSDAQRFQMLADRVVLHGHGTYLGQALSPPAWFETAGFWTRLLVQTRRTGLQAQSRFVQALGVNIKRDIPDTHGTEIERACVLDRHQIMAAVARLLAIDTAQLAEALRWAGVSQQGLQGPNRELPPAIAPIASTLPDRSIPHRKAPRPRPPGRRSRGEVRRMMRRLQLKLESR